MEKHYTEGQILEAYLNQINLGRGWYGVEAGVASLLRTSGGASSRSPKRRRSPGLPKSQPKYDPIAHPQRAKERRNLILQMMADQEYITQALADKTKLEPLVTAPNAGMSAAVGLLRGRSARTRPSAPESR